MARPPDRRVRGARALARAKSCCARLRPKPQKYREGERVKTDMATDHGVGVSECLSCSASQRLLLLLLLLHLPLAPDRLVCSEWRLCPCVITPTTKAPLPNGKHAPGRNCLRLSTCMLHGREERPYEYDEGVVPSHSHGDGLWLEFRSGAAIRARREHPTQRRRW